MKRLEGKIALVTGASRGIGRGIALRLAEEGAQVAVHYGHNPIAAEEVVRAIADRGGQAFAIGARLESVAGVHQLITSLKEELDAHSGGKLDILVNNAGIGTSQTLEETTEESFDELFAVNVKAPFFLIQQILPLLADGGRIINISSGVTRIAYPHIMAYNLTKGALNTFTLHLAQLLGPRQITVNAVLPGIVDTDVNASWLHTPEGQKHAADMSALGRVGQPNDIADVVAFLASGDSRWVTGQLIDATGGSHL
ncbi:SDR family oxidoreductase [Brevibacillus choshinensis]|uniref:SDR family oxidoreductase n=1 Tax=Brevibacillus choshinensis TaxID=54911 RepID=A0ABX7FTE2_BRECH|nr:SDR family oxidoreductase [Brevibacillus choshinensis]QRG69020.1 SDR family oxidoreductase [Brevibacillus choshinensis]